MGRPRLTDRPLFPGKAARKTAMKLLTHIPAFLRNKYLIATAAFAMVILFLDKNDLFTLRERGKELQDLEQSKQYYSREIEAQRKESEALIKDPARIEKFAREKYLMKKDGEEIFLVPENSDKTKN